MIEFERRLDAEVRRQEKLDIVEKRDFKREKLLGKLLWLKSLDKNKRTQ